MNKLSVVLATRNEEENIAACLTSVKDIADEIIIFDEESSDKTVEIAKGLGAKVTEVKHESNFHITKQKAIEAASGEWILQLDADERVTKKLASEVKKVIEMGGEDLEKYEDNLPKKKLFARHLKLVEERDGKIGSDGEFVAFFVPRLNYFLGRYLKYGGVYPDGVIRLVKKGYGRLGKDVHEQMTVDGRVGWLQNDLLHIDSPNFSRYLARNSRYIEIIAGELKEEKVKKDLWQGMNYFIVKPIYWFLLTTIRHKGILDGVQGIIFSFFSALRFPRAYWRYLTK